MPTQLFLFPGFHLQTLRRRPRSARTRLALQADRFAQKSLTELSACFGSFIPSALLYPSEQGLQSRQRLFSKHNTFWGFFSQILDADGGCKEVVRKVQAFAGRAKRALPSGSRSTRRASMPLTPYSKRGASKATLKGLICGKVRWPRNPGGWALGMRPR